MLTIKLTNTSAGLIAIQRALAGEDITFTKLDIGDGVLTNLDISNFTGVINKIKDYPLGVVKPEGQEMVRLRANINNVGITEDKAIREFGLYAKFGSSEQEFLFAYMNTGDIPTALPSSSGGRYDLNRDFVLYIGSSTNVTFDTNGDLVYSTLNDYKALEAQKEDKFPKNNAFNKNFGVLQNEVLEGHRMAQIQGVEKFGGDVQTPGVKKVGFSYWCTANKDFYVCKVENSLNYIDNAYFDAFSNAALLGKLQNLSESTVIGAYTIPDSLTLNSTYNFRLTEDVENFMMVGYYVTDSKYDSDLFDSTCYGIYPAHGVYHSATFLSDGIMDTTIRTNNYKYYEFRRVNCINKTCEFRVASIFNSTAIIDSNNRIVVVGICRIKN